MLHDGIIRNLLGRTYLRDYTHASKIFLPGVQGNAPKVKFTFHTYFEINTKAWTPPTGMNYGLLVKQVKLPSFSFDTTEMNQYNRKRIIQSKIKYQPVDIVFHDDNASQMTAMWNAYYQYNYADSWNPNVDPTSTSPSGKAYNRRNIYDASITGNTEYGYRGGANNDGGDIIRPNYGTKVPFFKQIIVYGMWQGNFIEYTLINPIITNFAHDTYDYGEGGGIMQNTMTIDYETVLYNTGKIDQENTEKEIPGFANQANYDKSESPLGGLGGVNSILDFFAKVGDMNSISLAELYALKKTIDSGQFEENTKNQILNGLQAFILDRLTGGNRDFKDFFFGADGASGTMVNIANQGLPTAASTATTPTGVTNQQSGTMTAGQQVVVQAATLYALSRLGG